MNVLNVKCCLFSVNNMNMHEGVTTPYIVGGDVFFEIVEPSQLRYTYRIRPATNFGGEFVRHVLFFNTLLIHIHPVEVGKILYIAIQHHPQFSDCANGSIAAFKIVYFY